MQKKIAARLRSLEEIHGASVESTKASCALCGLAECCLKLKSKEFCNYGSKCAAMDSNC